MKFFRQAEPGIFVAIGTLATEQDGIDWTGEYEQLLAQDRPFAVIVYVNEPPLPPAGKPMVLWLKARKADLGRLVKVTLYIVEDAAERAQMQRTLPGRAKASPYPMALAASEAEAIGLARASLG